MKKRQKSYDAKADKLMKAEQKEMKVLKKLVKSDKAVHKGYKMKDKK